MSATAACARVRIERPAMIDVQPIPHVGVLGILGAARAGKDTVASFLLKLCPGAERFTFSDLLAVRERLAGRMAKRDARHLQDASKGIDRDLFLSAMYYAIDDRRPPLAIITGVRNDDEVRMIRQMGGKLVRVVRLEPDGSPYVDPGRDPHHPIEAQIPRLPHDAVLTARSGDLDALEAQAGSLV